MVQIKSDGVVGTAIVLAAFAGGFCAPVEPAASSELKRSALFVIDGSTESTNASTMRATITSGIERDLLPMIGVAMASREVKLPADIAAIICRNLHDYWD